MGDQVTSPKRLNYFRYQLLAEKDFQDEQQYHLERRRLHQRLLHAWGVLEGLEVQRRSDREITVERGIAIDQQGRELVLDSPVHRTIDAAGNAELWITLGYHEDYDDSDRQSIGGVDGFTRVTERPEITVREDRPPPNDGVIELARVLVDAGAVQKVDNGVRRRASAMLADGSVTEERLEFQLRSAIRRRGWVRMPFKPVRFEHTRIGGRLIRPSDEPPLSGEFIIDIDSAYCDDAGARGTMAIPVPPGATAIHAFRIAGAARKKVEVELYRVGIGPDGRPEKTLLLEAIITDRVFQETLEIPKDKRHLDPELHAIAVLVAATGKAEIGLIAAEFE